MSYWEIYSYNFDSYEYEGVNAESPEADPELVAQSVAERGEDSLIEFLSNGGMYIKDNEDGTLSYASCRINGNAEICIETGDIKYQNILNNSDFAEYAAANGKTPAELFEENSLNAASYIMEQDPQSYFSYSPISAEEAVKKLREVGLFTNEFYYENVSLVETESDDCYIYLLYSRGMDNEFSETYNGDIYAFDSVIEAMRFCKDNSLTFVADSGDIERMLETDMQRLGGNLFALTETAIDQLNAYPVNSLKTIGDINKVYNEVMRNFKRETEVYRKSIEADIEENWGWNRDYREEPEEYFDINRDIAENIIQYRFEEAHANEIGYAFLFEQGVLSGHHFEICEDNLVYPNGLMLIEYDMSKDEYTQGMDIPSNIPYETTLIDLDHLRSSKNSIPDSFWDKLYAKNDDYIQIKDRPKDNTKNKDDYDR